jgi:hypothetical protein
MSANPRCLFVVSDTFIIRGRGIVLCPGIIPKGEERFRWGDSVELRRPDGTVLRVKIAIELLSPTPKDGSFPILLAEPSRKEDVPIGTEVWSI